MRPPDATLGATLRVWRDRVDPAAVGLPARHNRRVRGLRREELADLAGLSVDYVVRLEQGRATAPSAQVVAALARALRLDDAERDHLYRLAGLAVPSDDEVSDHVPPGLQRVLGRLGDATAAAVFAADWQLLWWNRAWSGLFGDPSARPPVLRNFARETFAGHDAAALSAWPVVSQDAGSVEAAVVSDLRRATGRFPRSTRLSDLVRDLTTSSERFAALWDAGAVGAHREGHKVVAHPVVGPITVDCDVMSDGEADRKVVLLTAVPGSEDESRLRLAIVTGAPAADASAFAGHFETR